MKKILFTLSAVVLLFAMAFMTACGEENKPKIGDSGYWEINAPDMIELDRWNIAISSAPSNLITVRSDNEEVVFNCVTERGSFYEWPEWVKQREINPNETIEWFSQIYEEHITQDYVDIIVEENENIMGYAVIKITEKEYFSYSARVLKSVLFPQIDGEYQSVEREKVEEAIENIKIKNS